jgi:hypothetical protein
LPITAPVPLLAPVMIATLPASLPSLMSDPLWYLVRSGDSEDKTGRFANRC